MNKSETILKIDHVAKQYQLGAIGGTTFKEEIQRIGAKLFKKEDPTLKVGENRVGTHEKFWALNNISLEIKKGEAVGIIGHNGAGKSTLLKLLCRVTAPTKGTIAYNGRIVSMLEVGTGFHPELTGRENVYMNGAILGMSKREIDAKMEDIIEFSECRQFIDTPVKRYSSGMYVKLAFSVAAHLDADIMIMDEVLAVGDMQFQQKCLKKMSDAATTEGKTILYVSHNMNTIRQLCDRCIVLEKGRVSFDGDVEQGINIYLGTVEKIQRYYEYTKEYHSCGKSDGQFSIKSLEILDDSEQTKYKIDQKIDFVLTCHSNKKLENVKLRFEIKFQDGSLAGTMLSDHGIDFFENEDKEITLCLDTTHLAPGKYRADIVTYVYDQFGAEYFLDGVYPGIIFEIDSAIDEKNQLNWLHQYWGHVHLQDVKVIKS